MQWTNNNRKGGGQTATKPPPKLAVWSFRASCLIYTNQKAFHLRFEIIFVLFEPDMLLKLIDQRVYKIDIWVLSADLRL